MTEKEEKGICRKAKKQGKERGRDKERNSGLETFSLLSHFSFTALGQRRGRSGRKKKKKKELEYGIGQCGPFS